MVKDLNQTLENLNFPLSKQDKKTDDPQKPQPVKTTLAEDSSINTRFKEAMAIPVPANHDHWFIEDLRREGKKEGVLAKFLKKKALGVNEINDLKKEAIQSPGNTRTKIQKLKKLYPYNSELYMLSAVCTNGMLMNSSNRDEVLRGLRFAVKEAATCLLNNGISLYNCESFFAIYFVMLDRFKRAQAKAHGLLTEDPKLVSLRNQLAPAMKSVDFMLSEKSKVVNVINHLKKKLKSSNYTALFDSTDIQEAANNIEKGKPKEPCKFGTATEMMSYVYALSMTFAHTPLLTRLVEKILKLIPDKDVSLLARKISISSIRRFGTFKLALAEQNKDEMIRIAQTILRENKMGLSKMGGQALYHSYEADLFLNLAYVVELTPGLFPPKEYIEMADKAIEAMQVLMEKDMSKEHSFTESAKTHLRRLNQLREENLDTVKKTDGN
ncbi:hypothetical protein KJ966_05800 [bacterium]|nr:hypothetical protein [bacterium]